MKKTKLLIIGSGGHAKSCIEIIENIQKFKIMGLIDSKKNKTIVITDRFTDSTYAYQSIGQGISKKINDINKEYILKKLKPNLTIVLKSSFNSIFLRLKKRKNKNRYDKLNKKFYSSK